MATLLGAPVTGFGPDLHPAVEIHQRTVFSGLLKALALSFPTIRSLTGLDYFEHLVREFARKHPPRSAVLYDYGAELPAFLQTFPGAEGYPYFGDVARFDWLVDQTAHRPTGHSGAARVIPNYGTVWLPASLTCARFDFAVDSIRDAVEIVRTGETPSVDVGPNKRWLALWRSASGTSVKALSSTAWDILNAVAAGHDGLSSLEREECGAAQALVALRDEIMTSSFIRLDLQEP